MHSNLVELIENQFDDEAIKQLSKLFGESTAATKAAVKSSVIRLLDEILEFEVTDKNSPLLQTLRNQTDRLRDNLANRLRKGQHNRLIKKGSALLTSLLGEENFSILVNELSDSNQLPRESMRSIVGITAPVMFSSIRQVARDGEMNRSALQQFFDSQKNYIPKKTAANRPINIKTNTGNPIERIQQWLQFNKIAWLAILIGLTFAAFNFLQPLNTANTNKPTLVAVNNAKQASVSITQRELIELLTYIGKTFGKVKDRETAKIALSIIQDATIKLEDLSDEYNQLAEPEKKRINTVVIRNLNALKSTEKDFKTIPGVSSVLKTSIDDLAQKLNQYSKS